MPASFTADKALRPTMRRIRRALAGTHPLIEHMLRLGLKLEREAVRLP